VFTAKVKFSDPNIHSRGVHLVKVLKILCSRSQFYY